MVPWYVKLEAVLFLFQHDISLLFIWFPQQKNDIYILGVARYTNVMVQYVPQFGCHGLTRFRYNSIKKIIFNLFWTDSSANKKKIHLDAKILIINTNTIITLLYYV